jgi:hypothetical protein
MRAFGQNDLMGPLSEERASGRRPHFWRGAPGDPVEGHECLLVMWRRPCAPSPRLSRRSLTASVVGATPGSTTSAEGGSMLQGVPAFACRESTQALSRSPRFARHRQSDARSTEREPLSCWCSAERFAVRDHRPAPRRHPARSTRASRRRASHRPRQCSHRRLARHDGHIYCWLSVSPRKSRILPAPSQKKPPRVIRRATLAAAGRCGREHP